MPITSPWSPPIRHPATSLCAQIWSANLLLNLPAGPAAAAGPAGAAGAAGAPTLRAAAPLVAAPAPSGASLPAAAKGDRGDPAEARMALKSPRAVQSSSGWEGLWPPAAAPEPPTILTVLGVACQLPFYFRGAAHSECVTVSPSQPGKYCLDIEGDIGRCSDGLTTQFANFSRWIDQWAGNPQVRGLSAHHAQPRMLLCTTCSKHGGNERLLALLIRRN